MPIDNKHFVIDRRAIFAFFDMEIASTKKCCIMRVAYIVFKTIDLEPIDVDAALFHVWSKVKKS